MVHNALDPLSSKLTKIKLHWNMLAIVIAVNVINDRYTDKKNLNISTKLSRISVKTKSSFLIGLSNIFISVGFSAVSYRVQSHLLTYFW